MPLVAKHQTSKAALISRERMAFSSDAYLTLRNRGPETVAAHTAVP